MHEIVTLQFGQRANYLATHFWNIQESYFTYGPSSTPSPIDHDIHFRPGIGTDGSDTYTPRTLIYDLKGGFGTLKQLNALYDDISASPSSAPTVWNDRGLTTIKQPAIVQTFYQQNLDQGLPTRQLQSSDIRFWSDFNRVYFHPRSIVQLSEYTLNDSIRPFSNWAAGAELYRDVDRQVGGILDRDVRLFVEECDSMQGFQVFAGTDDAWGGWTGAYVDALRDEFGKKSIWVLGVEGVDDGQREERIARKANVARTLGDVRDKVSAYVRLGGRPGKVPGYADGQLGSEWERTALIAAGLESVMLPMRVRDGAGRGSSMGHFEQILNTNEGQNVWELGLSAKWEGETVNGNGRVRPQPEKYEDEGEDDSTAFEINFTPETSSLLPNTLARADQRKTRTHVFAQIETTRQPKRSSDSALPPQPLSQEDLLRRRYHEQAIVEHFVVPLGFPRLDAYPADLFRDPGEVAGQRELTFSAGFTTSSNVKQDIFDLRNLVTRYSRAVAVDEREDLYNGLTEIGEKYTFGWDSGSDENED